MCAFPVRSAMAERTGTRLARCTRTKGGFSIRFDSLPIPNDKEGEVMALAFEPKDQQSDRKDDAASWRRRNAAVLLTAFQRTWTTRYLLPPAVNVCLQKMGSPSFGVGTTSEPPLT